MPAGQYEILAVLSAQYAGLYGSGLSRAITTGERAEAWFELRYNWTNSGNASMDAFAKRRYAEAALFGLNDSDGVSSDEARQVFQMLQLHRARIEEYEASYGANAIINGQADLNVAFTAAGMNGSAPTIQALVDDLENARAKLIGDLTSQYTGIGNAGIGNGADRERCRVSVFR